MPQPCSASRRPVPGASGGLDPSRRSAATPRACRRRGKVPPCLTSEKDRMALTRPVHYSFSWRSQSCTAVLAPARAITPRTSPVSRPWVEELYFSVELHPTRRERRGGRCALCGHYHRPSGLQGRAHAVPEPGRPAVPPGADSGKERRGPLNYPQSGVLRVVEMDTKRVPKPPSPRTWRVSLIKKKMEYVGACKRWIRRARSLSRRPSFS